MVEIKKKKFCHWNEQTETIRICKGQYEHMNGVSEQNNFYGWNKFNTFGLDGEKEWKILFKKLTTHCETW